MSFYAHFESVAGNTFRFDTRIYLGEHNIEEDGECVGAIVGKNPGSATSSQLGVWTQLQLNGDKMLPSVRNRFVDAYQKAGKSTPDNAFVQVWNLFYLCDPELDAACLAINDLTNPPVCPSESKKPKVIWFAWGGSDHLLNPFKKRFLSQTHFGGFYYCNKSKSVVAHPPSDDDFAKHPQGMPALPVVNYLANAL